MKGPNKYIELKPFHKYKIKKFPIQLPYQCLNFEYCKECKVRFHSA